jgi:hypothetical protein
MTTVSGKKDWEEKRSEEKSNGKRRRTRKVEKG